MELQIIEAGKLENKEIRNWSHESWSFDLLFVLSFTKDEMYPYDLRINSVPFE